jgi:hypothetical protein
MQTDGWQDVVGWETLVGSSRGTGPKQLLLCAHRLLAPIKW